MILLSKYRNIAIISTKYAQLLNNTASCIMKYKIQWRNTASKPKKCDVISAIEKKFGYNTEIATEMYSKFPALQTHGAIKDDTLKLLRSKAPEETVLEYPLLATLETGEFYEYFRPK